MWRVYSKLLIVRIFFTVETRKRQSWVFHQTWFFRWFYSLLFCAEAQNYKTDIFATLFWKISSHTSFLYRKIKEARIMKKLFLSKWFVSTLLRLCKKCPYSGFFWSAFSPNAEKYRLEKLRIRTLFTQCKMQQNLEQLWSIYFDNLKNI